MSAVEEVPTLVTSGMIESKGVWGETTVSFPVTESDIRRWAIAVYWPEKPPRLFWDKTYAKTTRWGGIIAPQDFNPFAWPVDRPGRASPGPMPGEVPKKGQNVLNGGQKDTFYAPMRPGDVVKARARLSHWEERQGRHGLTLFEYNEVEWRNQHDQVIKHRMRTTVRY